MAGETKVVDVIEEEGGLLHVTAEKLKADAGDLVLLSRDIEHRRRLERTTGAAAVSLAALADAGIEVNSVEIVAGMAWIEVMEPAPRIDLAAICAAGDEIQVSPQHNGRMLVRVGDREVTTYFAPVVLSTLEIGAAALRPVAEGAEDREVLEVSLPDSEGREWWL
jgi:hypothetical protein